MTVNKRTKNSRQRGSHTHGWGAKKKHRGSGHRGGKGLASTGKRADARKPSVWALDYFGKHGFISKTTREKINPVNIDYLDRNLEDLSSKNMITKENDFYSVDLKKLGFNKILGNGKVLHKYRIKTSYASKGAVEKIKEAGGEIILSAKNTEQ